MFWGSGWIKMSVDIEGYFWQEGEVEVDRRQEVMMFGEGCDMGGGGNDFTRGLGGGFFLFLDLSMILLWFLFGTVYFLVIDLSNVQFRLCFLLPVFPCSVCPLSLTSLSSYPHVPFIFFFSPFHHKCQSDRAFVQQMLNLSDTTHSTDVINQPSQ